VLTSAPVDDQAALKHLAMFLFMGANDSLVADSSGLCLAAVG